WPPLEWGVRRGRARLLTDQLVRIHAEAHRAAGAAPLEAGVPEYLIDAAALGRAAGALRAGNDQRPHGRRHTMPLDDPRRLLEIREAAVGARPDEGDVDL